MWHDAQTRGEYTGTQEILLHRERRYVRMRAYVPAGLTRRRFGRHLSGT